MSQLSPVAAGIITFAREGRLLEETSLKQLSALFSHRVDMELVQSLVLGRETGIARDLFKLMLNLHAVDTMGYVLRFTADVLQLAPSLVTGFVLDEITNPVEMFGGVNPVAHFQSLVATHRDTLGVFNPSVFLFACVLAATPDLDTVKDGVSAFILICHEALTAVELITPRNEYVIPAMCHFLRRPELREPFMNARLVAHLPRLLAQVIAVETSWLVQLTYETLWAIRLISFEMRGVVELHEAKIIPVVHRAMQRVTKDKNVRMSFYVVLNFLRAQEMWLQAKHHGSETVPPAVQHLGFINRGKGPVFYSELIGVGVLKTAQQIIRKTFGDADIPVLGQEIVDILQRNLEDVTSWSEYKGEVQSGILEWSPAHTSVKFWRENIKNIDQNDWEVVKELAALLTAKEDMTVAVACHDLGEIVRHHPTGKMILTLPALRGTKERIMQLMSSTSAEVAKHSLTAVQKILVQKWDR